MWGVWLGLAAGAALVWKKNQEERARLAVPALTSYALDEHFPPLYRLWLDAQLSTRAPGELESLARWCDEQGYPLAAYAVRDRMQRISSPPAVPFVKAPAESGSSSSAVPAASESRSSDGPGATTAGAPGPGEAPSSSPLRAALARAGDVLRSHRKGLVALVSVSVIFVGFLVARAREARGRAMLAAGVEG